MAGASLLTRIEHAADPHNTERHTWRDHDVEAAVISHILQMLSTRQGSSLTCPDYGMPDLSELLHNAPDAPGIMQRAIKQCLTTYEPRLKNVQVRNVPPPEDTGLIFDFEVTAQLIYPDGSRTPFRFRTAFDHSGVRATPGI